MNKCFSDLVTDAKQTIKEISISEVKQKVEDQSIQNCHFVDIREESEWQLGGLPHAVHASRGVLEAKIENIVADRNAEIILYCGGGSRSALAAESLQKMGYTNVKSMAGGFRGWVMQAV